MKFRSKVVVVVLLALLLPATKCWLVAWLVTGCKLQVAGNYRCTFIKYKIFLHGIWKTTCSLELPSKKPTGFPWKTLINRRLRCVSAKCDFNWRWRWQLATCHVQLTLPVVPYAPVLLQQQQQQHLQLSCCCSCNVLQLILIALLAQP